jgi:hypothetical protein
MRIKTSFTDYYQFKERQKKEKRENEKEQTSFQKYEKKVKSTMKA